MDSNVVNEGPPPHPSVDPANRNPTTEDDDSEWEYEYSKTETETFYVTLDLSKAEWAHDNNEANDGHGSRHAHKRAERFLNRRKGESSSSSSSSSSSDPGDPDADGEDGSDSQQRASRKRKRKGSKDKAAKDGDEDSERVQILDLHTRTPLISYKGHVYSGAWSENVTTELLLMKHDDHGEPPLPVVRSLGKGVDLLAASSARITVREQEIHEKEAKQQRVRYPVPEPPRPVAHAETIHDFANATGEKEPEKPPANPYYNDDWVPIPYFGAKRERQSQGKFLADLIAAKKERGEQDDVTVIALNAVRRQHDPVRYRQKKLQAQAEAERDEHDNPLPPPKRRRRKPDPSQTFNLDLENPAAAIPETESKKKDEKKKDKEKQKPKERAPSRGRARARPKQFLPGVPRLKWRRERGKSFPYQLTEVPIDPPLRRNVDAPVSTQTPPKWGDLGSSQGEDQGRVEEVGDEQDGGEDHGSDKAGDADEGDGEGGDEEGEEDIDEDMHDVDDMDDGEEDDDDEGQGEGDEDMDESDDEVDLVT
ncbi:hypothetical protein F4780DRAFT_114160 [Xylariomycetidae sp. FL0641]|nr:hypothetical protein F4780DRAFT_114160 [Xylariomycetidae sp. FL0641]